MKVDSSSVEVSLSKSHNPNWVGCCLAWLTLASVRMNGCKSLSTNLSVNVKA